MHELTHKLLTSTFGIPIIICLLFLAFYIVDKIWQKGRHINSMMNRKPDKIKKGDNHV